MLCIIFFSEEAAFYKSTHLISSIISCLLNCSFHSFIITCLLAVHFTFKNVSFLHLSSLLGIWPMMYWCWCRPASPTWGRKASSPCTRSLSSFLMLSVQRSLVLRRDWKTQIQVNGDHYRICVARDSDDHYQISNVGDDPLPGMPLVHVLCWYWGSGAT